MKTARLKLLAGYILASAVICWFFLYLLFPATALKNYLEQAFFRLNPEAEVIIATAETAFPLGLTLRGITYAKREKRKETLAIQYVTLTPDWLGILSGAPQLNIAGVIYGGSIGGSITADRFSSKGRQLTVKVDFKQVDIGRCLYLQGPTEKKLTGILAGSLSYRINDGARSEKAARGRIDVFIKNGVYHLPERIAGLEKAEFRDLEIKLDYQDGQFKINRLTLAGEGLRVNLTGTVTPDQVELADSLLDLRGSLETAPGKRLPLTVTGRVGSPQLILQ